MRRTLCALTCLLAAGCAGGPTVQPGRMAPFKAVVVFDWRGQEGADTESQEPASTEPLEGLASADGGMGGNGEAEDPRGPDFRKEVEGHILMGLEEYEVFSDFVFADLETLEAARLTSDEVARLEEADLIVRVEIGDLVEWDQHVTRTIPGLAVLNGLLWIGTGIGSWWIPDVVFPTNSEIEVAWKRPAEGNSAGASGQSPGGTDLGRGFRLKERLSTGEYALSLWDRAKPWDYPWAYLMSFLVPPVFVPLKDTDEVDRSLRYYAIEDVKQELAQKLRGGYLGSVGSPFLFRLDEPQNGGVVQGGRVKLRFEYRVQPGFEMHERTGLSALSIHVMHGSGGKYELWRTYDDSKLKELNELNAKIKAGQPIVEEVHGLEPGLNLIRLVALTEVNRQRITNTVAILRE